MELRQDALLLAKRGLRILPLHTPFWSTAGDAVYCSCHDFDCRSIGKHPRTNHGVKDASSEITTVDDWWQLWPDANIGIATGFDFDVLDIDGTEAYNEFLCVSNRDGLPTYIASVRTGRVDGYHYFCIPAGMKSTVLFKGLDVKGIGGYVVAPPSLHETGRRYEWRLSVLDDQTVDGASWPDWYRSVGKSQHSELKIVQPLSTRYGQAIGFNETVKLRILTNVRAAGEGSRWQTLSTVGIMDCARLIKGTELDEQDAETLLQEVAQEIGLSRSEVERIPRELTKAIANVHTPIVPRGPSQAVGQPTNSMISAASDALRPFSQVTEDFGADVLRLASLVDQQVFSMRAREIALDQLRREKQSTVEPIEDIELEALLIKEVPPQRYRIEELWPEGGIIVLTAQFKAGKTTLVGNIVRCLVDSGRFLSRYQCNAPQGRVALFDTEMSLGMLQRWLRDQAIENTQGVWIVPMKGQCVQFDITNVHIRDAWVKRIREKDIDVFVLDCLGPMLAACGLDENSNQDVGKFISAFEALIKESGVKEAMVVHHMGHTGERSRGSSRLRDWPDAEWQLIKEGQEDESRAPGFNAPRYFKAQGRDVYAAEQLLHYTPELRWLSVNVDDGSRVQIKAKRIVEDIYQFVRASPECSQRTILAAVTGNTAAKKDALTGLIQCGRVRIIEGPNNANLHFTDDYQAPK